MTTEKKTRKKRTIKKVEEADTAMTEAAATTCSCDCGDKIAALESKVEVIAQYMKTFNTFLNSNMITNTVDRAAEEGLAEVLDQYPS
tara:strand:- start:1093 stop:1353 length:261 start_codon:yes stop_codon:yes gene_type:complete